MATIANQTWPEQAGLSLEQQVIRMQALLEAARLVHSTIDLTEVLQQSARVAVLELEMDGALFTTPEVGFGQMPAAVTAAELPRFPLTARDGTLLLELVVAAPEGRELSLYERDFLEGLALQTGIAAENALNHSRHLEYARLARDLEAARTIQQSLLPQTMPAIPGYSLAARSSACYHVGGDYLDVVTEPSGSHLIVVADVAGKGMASALVCTAFRSAFRVLARQGLPLEDLAMQLSQQHWDEGAEARRRYVTAIFVRLDAAAGAIECVNAGHNPGFLVMPGGDSVEITASGTPVGMLAGTRYATEQFAFAPGARLLLYTDGMTEVFQEEEEFGEQRLLDTFRTLPATEAVPVLDVLWETLGRFSGNAPQHDDMTAVALCHLGAAGGANG